jgi:hypothetical protein
VQGGGGERVAHRQGRLLEKAESKQGFEAGKEF